MTAVLVIKTGALGDVLRTTSILPGLKSRFGELSVTWITADAALPLVERHPLIDHVITCDPSSPESVAAAGRQCEGQRWDWLMSFDDEQPLCALAAGLTAEKLTGATLDENGERVYTDDVEPWFGMGLLSRDGKAAADARKIANTRTHPEIFATMLGIGAGRPELPLPQSARDAARAFAERHDFQADRVVIGLNTGAGGRWTSKGLPVERVIAYAAAVAEASRDSRFDFLVLGGPSERERNQEILNGIRALGADVRAIDAGSDNDLPTFSALVALCDLLLTSDSLALHIGVAMDVPMVAFFAPTSAAEIELYGLGEKVASTADDYCTYRPDASNDTITTERLLAATERVLAANPSARRVARPGR